MGTSQSQMSSNLENTSLNARRSLKKAKKLLKLQRQQSYNGTDPFYSNDETSQLNVGEASNNENNQSAVDTVLDQIKISLTTYESTSSPATTHLQSNQKPVSHNNKDRQHTTHTKNKNSEREQHTVSCSSTAFASESVGNDRSTTKTLFGFQENCEKLLLDSASNILIETCSCNTAKRGSPIRTKTGEDQVTQWLDRSIVVKRDTPIISSSSDSIVTPPLISSNSRNKETRDSKYLLRPLTIQKLSPLEVKPGKSSDSDVRFQIVKSETININGDDISIKDVSDENNKMPIVRNNMSSEICQDNGADKGMFNVSRIKKVELSEISLAPDICTTPTTDQPIQCSQVSQPPSLMTPTGNGNSNLLKTPVGGKVLHRVITITASHQIDNTPVPKPAIIPEKLQFSAYEKFEGQMLINWFVQSLQSSAGTLSLNENVTNDLAQQYCTNLLKLGVMKHLVDSSSIAVAPPSQQETFKSNIMYQWTRNSVSSSTNVTPGRIETPISFQQSAEKKSPSKSRLLVDGESKIPKLMSSTPKMKQLLSNSGALTPSSPMEKFQTTTGIEKDSQKLNDIKWKLGKCDSVRELVQTMKFYLQENMMQSGSSSNSLILNNSVMNGSETTIFDKSEEQTMFNINQHRRNEPPASKNIHTPPRVVRKPRTQPSTPTSRTEVRKIRRNLSVESVNKLSTSIIATKPVEAINVPLCKRCMQSSTNPIKPINKRMVDKATVMEVEPIVTIPPKEFLSQEIQTDPIEEEKVVKSERDYEDATSLVKKVEPSIPIPPPPPMMNMSSLAPIPPAMPQNGPSPKIPGPPPIPSTLGSFPGIPPPPPFGLSNGVPLPIAHNTGSALRKNAVNPPKPMKPLYWTRIVAPIKSQDSIDLSPVAAASTLTEESKESLDSEELWQEIDETKLDNLDEFTELFSRQGGVPKARESIKIPKVKAIKVLDSKRSQNVGIFVRSVHVDFAEIEHAIYHCDTSIVSLETLQYIMEIKATPEELTMIKEAVSDSTETSPPLDAPERFLLRLSQISSSSQRISCIVFQAEFDEQCTFVSRKLLIVKSLCEFLLENENLKEVFSIILTLGNFMNGGNRQRGQADGFGLEILGKLKDVKSKDPKITLLHFIVKTYIERCRKGGCPLSDVELPVPDPNDIDKSLAIDFDECKLQLEALKKKLEDIKQTTEKVIAASTDEHVQPFKEKMENFLERSSQKIERRFQKLDTCKVLFMKTIKFYKFTPKSGTLDETKPSQFFEYWTSFTSDFNAIFKKEITVLTNEILKKARQVTKPQSKPTSGENNLKARINRLKSRDK